MDHPADGHHPTQSLPPKGRIAIEPSSRPRLPERIGRFGIRDILDDTGAMGIVYVAVQDSPRRTVAVKILRRGLTSPTALRRFEYESQILARLRHPNIAQVIESGTHDDGSGRVPFFAMEYVPGAKHLDQYVNEQELGIRGRLELFARVCDGVHHAHQKAIIHRDLKPSNILVDSNGEPKIIDFGVARGADADSAATAAQTKIGQLVGTLRYMSPEQVDGDPNDLDVRSDVYALGVILYELLCERPPYDVDTVSIVNAARTIRETKPLPPRSLRRSLRGDLETIVLKALEKSRQRRYQSAAELAEDVRRYLGNEPIRGRRVTLVYRFSRLVRRYPRTTIVAGVVSLCMLGLAWNLVLMFLAMQHRSACIAQAEHFMNPRDSRDSKTLIRFVKSPEHGGREVLVIMTPGSKGDYLHVFDPQPRELETAMKVPPAVSWAHQGTNRVQLAGAIVAEDVPFGGRPRNVIVTLENAHNSPAAMVMRDFKFRRLATIWNAGHIISVHWNAESGLLLAAVWSNALGDALPTVQKSFSQLDTHHREAEHENEINPAVIVAIRLDTIAPGSSTVLFPRIGDAATPMATIDWMLAREPNLELELGELANQRLSLHSVEPPSDPDAIGKIRVRWRRSYEQEFVETDAWYFETNVSTDGTPGNWKLIDPKGDARTIPVGATPVLTRLDWKDVQRHARTLRAKQPTNDKP